MITEFRHIIALTKTMERNVEQLVEDYNKLLEKYNKLKEEYDKCKTNSEKSSQEISSNDSGSSI